MNNKDLEESRKQISAKQINQGEEVNKQNELTLIQRITSSFQRLEKKDNRSIEQELTKFLEDYEEKHES
jgi:hypothetical protein